MGLDPQDTDMLSQEFSDVCKALYALANPQWEYTFISRTDPGLAPILERLNELGAKGWEYIETWPDTNMIILKRSKD